MKKIFILLLLLIVVTNCNKHYIRNVESNKFSDNKIFKLKQSKIALVGFYPFKAKITVEGNKRVYQNDIDVNHSTADYLGFGKNVSEYKTQGLDNSIPKKNIENFIKNFKLIKGEIIKDELSEIFENLESENIDTIQLRKRDVDYYIVGLHLRGDLNPMSFKRALSTTLSMGTLYLLPSWYTIETVSVFLVYDSKLNKIDEQVYKNDVQVISSLWGNDPEEEGMSLQLYPPDSFSEKMYKPDVKEFSNRYIEKIK